MMYKGLNLTMKIVLAIFVVLQVFLVIHYYGRLEVNGDAFLYINNAIYHAGIGKPYPTVHNLYDIYIQSPGYINFVALLYKIFGTYQIVLIFKVIFNFAIIYEIYYLAKMFFNKSVAQIAVILYCLMPTNIFASISYLNEIDYLFLALTAFCLSLRYKSFISLILGGLILACAHMIRPIEIVIIICLIIFYIAKKCDYKTYVSLFAPYILLLGAFGFYCKQQTGTFITTSTVTGHNLIFIANDQSDGNQNHTLKLHADKGKIGYIPNIKKVTFIQKDSIWKSRGIKWIEENPIHYLKSYLRGATVVLFRNDSWSLPLLSPYDDINEVKKMENPKKAHIILYARQVLYSLMFYITVLFFFITLYRKRKDLFSLKGLFVLIPFMNIAGVSLLGTTARYHYTFVFAMIIWASYGIYDILSRSRKSHVS